MYKRQLHPSESYHVEFGDEMAKRWNEHKRIAELEQSLVGGEVVRAAAVARAEKAEGLLQDLDAAWVSSSADTAFPALNGKLCEIVRLKRQFLPEVRTALRHAETASACHEKGGGE